MESSASTNTCALIGFHLIASTNKKYASYDLPRTHTALTHIFWNGGKKIHRLSENYHTCARSFDGRFYKSQLWSHQPVRIQNAHSVNKR
jgi:hypothetical protein